jgi:hypothetical protein
LRGYILKLTIKVPGQKALDVKGEITDYDEINDKIFDVDMNVWDNARNITEPISFHYFHDRSNSMIDI